MSAEAGEGITPSKSLSVEDGPGDGDAGSAPREGEPATLQAADPETENLGDSLVSKTQERLARFKALQARAVSSYIYTYSFVERANQKTEKCSRA